MQFAMQSEQVICNLHRAIAVISTPANGKAATLYTASPAGSCLHKTENNHDN
jgi:hypothetical protein